MERHRALHPIPRITSRAIRKLTKNGGKICLKCRLEKPFSEFHQNKSADDGKFPYCKDCKSIERRRRYSQNRQHALEQIRGYYNENKAIIIASNGRWRRLNVVNNPDRKARYQATQRAWRRANPDWMAALNARRRRQTAEGYTPEEWTALKALYDHRCLCCGRREPEIRLEPDHVIPLVKHGPNLIGNIQPLCKTCNRRKAAKTTDYRWPRIKIVNS
jgi:5-methylcytosine-specific restriction endonuclease McrA